MVDLGKFKSFAMNLGIGVGLQIVRDWFNEQLKNVTPSDIYNAVINDADLWSMTPSDVKNAGLKYQKTYGGLFKKYQDEVSTEILLQWLKEDHPSLFSTLINIPLEYGKNAGLLWFDKQVQKIKQEIINTM